MFAAKLSIMTKSHDTALFSFPKNRLYRIRTRPMTLVYGGSNNPLQTVRGEFHRGSVPYIVDDAVIKIGESLQSGENKHLLSNILPTVT